MPSPSTSAAPRRLLDTRHPLLTALAMLATMGLMAGGVIISLPADATSGTPVVESVDAEAGDNVADLLDGPASIVLPVPDGDDRTTSTIVNHRRSGVEVTSRLANGDGLQVELSAAGARATSVTITVAAAHHCGRYAGSLILEASHADRSRDTKVVDLRFAECEDTTQVAMGPASAHDLEPTWGDDGRAPWDQQRVTAAAPAPEPVTEPSSERESEPAPEPAPTSEPEPEPTSETTTEPAPEPTSETTTEPAPEPTTSGTSEPSSPSASPTTG